MPDDKLPIPQFAAKIKAKYPQYRGMNDTLLTQKILEKHPEYKEMVDFTPAKTAQQPSQEPMPKSNRPIDNIPKLDATKPYQEKKQVDMVSVGAPKLIAQPHSEKTVDVIHGDKVLASRDNIVKTLNGSDKNVEALMWEDETREVQKQYADARANNGSILKIETPTINHSAEAVAQKKSALLSDPVGQSKLIDEIVKANPEKAKQIKYDWYLHLTDYSLKRDENGRVIDPNASLVLKNAEGIKKGKLEFDVKTGQLTKPENFVDAFMTGWGHKRKTFEDYHFIDTHTDAENIAKLNSDAANANPFEATPVPKDIAGELSSSIGSMPVQGLVIGAAANAIPVVGQTLSPFIAAAASAPDFYKMAYVAELQKTYFELKQEGLSDEEAYAKAKEQAKYAGNVEATSGAIMTLAGSRLPTAGKLNLTGGFKKATINYIKGASKEGLIKIGEATGVGLMMAESQHLKNVHANKLGAERHEEEGVFAAGENGFVLTLGIAAAIKGGSALTKGARKSIMYGAAKVKPELIDQSLGNLIIENKITPEEANSFKAEVEEQKKSVAGIPDNIHEEAALKIESRIQKRNELQKQLESSDEAFHPELKEKIKTINEEIISLSKSKEEKPELTENRLLITKMLNEKPNFPDFLKIHAEADPDAFLKEVADQSTGRMSDGSVSIRPDAEVAAREYYGDDVVDAALKQFPLEKSKVSVILPNEINKPEIITPESNKGVADQQSEAAPSILSKEQLTEKFLEMAGAEFDTAYDYGLTKGMSTADRLKAVKDIKAGKDSAPARRLQAIIDEIHETGEVTLYRGRGKNVEEARFPAHEWFGEPLEPKALEAVDKISDPVMEYVKNNGITLDNIEQFKNLFDGFPFDEADYHNVKAELARQSADNAATPKVSEERPQEQSHSTEEIAVGEPPTAEIPPTTGGVHVERPSVELSHKGLQDVANQVGLRDVQSRETKSDIQTKKNADVTIQDWMDKGVYRKNIEGLISDAEQGKILSDEQRLIVEQHLANLKNDLENTSISDPAFKQKENEIYRVFVAGEKTRSEAGAALRIPNGGTRANKMLADYLAEDREANLGAELTDKQIETAKTEYDNINSAKKAYEDKVASLKEEEAKKLAAKSVKRVKKSSTKKSHDEYVAERKKIFEDIKEKLRKSRSELSAVPVPYAKELIAISPEVAKLVKNLVEEGIDKLEDIVKNIHTQLKEDLPDLTQKDIHNIIAGEYTEKKQSRNDIAKQVFELKQQAQLINEFEKLEAGEAPKTEKQKVKRNQDLEALRKKIKEHDVTKLADYKKKTLKEIEKLEEDLKTGNFDHTKEKKEIPLDAEAKDLKDKLVKLQQERDIRLLKEQYQNRSLQQRASDWIVDKANIPRTIMASMDFSAPLRQGAVAVAAHPIMASKAAISMFKSAGSQKHFDAWFYDLKNSKNYEIIRKSGLAVSDPHSPFLAAKEEAFMNNTAEKIPIIGKLIKGSERAYVMFLNKMRVDLFNRGVDAFEAAGKTMENSPELYEALANLINNQTGRGNLGFAESAAPVLNSVFFSPRLIASRVNLLTKWADPRFYKNVPKEVRVMYFKDMLKFIGFGTAILGLAKLNGADVENDPRSSDFGKIKSGNTRWDIWGGFQQYVRLISQIATGERKSSNTGKIQELDGTKAFGTTRSDVGIGFFRNKLAPVPSMAVDFFSQKTSQGDPVTVKGELTSHFLPLLYSDIKDAMKDRGVSALFTVGVPSIFGVGVQTHTKKDKKKERKIATKKSED